MDAICYARADMIDRWRPRSICGTDLFKPRIQGLWIDFSEISEIPQTRNSGFKQIRPTDPLPVPRPRPRPGFERGETAWRSEAPYIARQGQRPPFVQGRFPKAGVYRIGAENVEMTCQKLLPKIVVFFGNYFPFPSIPKTPAFGNRQAAPF